MISRLWTRKVHYLVWLMCLGSNSSFFFLTISFWEFHPTRRVPEGDRNPSMWTARVVSWEVPDQTGVLFLSLVGKFEKSERFARAKHVLHVYGNNLEKNEKTISSLWMGLVRHWRHSISREDSTDMVIVLVNVMVQNECGIFKVKYRSKETVFTIIWYFSIIISFIHQSW